ncbi:MAG: hypothetical protein ABW170_07925 [Candidatus Thiodiazotropha sp. L084R]
MTEAIESWLTPLLFISVPTLMILSNAARYAQQHGEIHFVHEQAHNNGERELRHGRLQYRTLLFRNAQVALYGPICLFAIPG